MATAQRDIRFDSKMCTGCYKMCRFVCPTAIATKNESITPYGRSSAYYLASINKITYSPKAVESIYQCATCGLCKTWCKPDVDVAKIVETARRDIVAKKLAPRNVSRLIEITQENSNPYGEPNSERFSKIKLGATRKSGKSEVLYFVGCTTAYRHPEIADAIVKVLTLMGEDFSVIADAEECCGSPLIRLGLEDTAKQLLAHNSKAINELESKIIVTGCPGCYRTLKEDYPRLRYKLDAEVMHFTEYLDSAGKGIPRAELTRRVTYHDPCHLGRHSNIIEQPRNILQQVKGIRYIEMDWNKKNSKCCGSGGGLKLSYPKTAEAIGLMRLDEAYSTGAEIIATACPFCKDHMIDLQNTRMETKRAGVVDLAEILTGTVPR
jgi:heterodisulfide reductase subunit D